MKTLHADFESRSQANRAIQAVLDAGITADNIRIWNIMPQREHPPARGGLGMTGATLGALLGETDGHATGDSVSQERDESGLGEDPPGTTPRVCVVVNLNPTSPNLAPLLKENGALHVT